MCFRSGETQTDDTRGVSHRMEKSESYLLLLLLIYIYIYMC